MCPHTGSTECGTSASWPTVCDRRNSPSAARCWGMVPNPVSRKGPRIWRHPSPPWVSQALGVRSANTAACNWSRRCIDSRRHGTCLCPPPAWTPHRGRRRRSPNQSWTAGLDRLDGYSASTAPGTVLILHKGDEKRGGAMTDRTRLTTRTSLPQRWPRQRMRSQSPLISSQYP